MATGVPASVTTMRRSRSFSPTSASRSRVRQWQRNPASRDHSVESNARRAAPDCPFHILDGAVGGLAGDLLGGRMDDIEERAAGGRLKLAVDQHP